MLSHGSHVLRGERLDQAVHDWRVAKLVLDDLQLSNDIGSMFAGQSREERVSFSAGAMTGRTRRDFVRRVPLIEKNLTLGGELRVAGSCERLPMGCLLLDGPQPARR